MLILWENVYGALFVLFFVYNVFGYCYLFSVISTVMFVTIVNLVTVIPFTITGSASIFMVFCLFFSVAVALYMKAILFSKSSFFNENLFSKVRYGMFTGGASSASAGSSSSDDGDKDPRRNYPIVRNGGESANPSANNGKNEWKIKERHNLDNDDSKYGEQESQPLALQSPGGVPNIGAPAPMTPGIGLDAVRPGIEFFREANERRLAMFLGQIKCPTEPLEAYNFSEFSKFMFEHGSNYLDFVPAEYDCLRERSDGTIELVHVVERVRNCQFINGGTFNKRVPFTSRGCGYS